MSKVLQIGSVLLALALAGYGQNSGSPAPPPAQKLEPVPPGSIDNTNLYPFAEALKRLENTGSRTAPPPSGPVSQEQAAPPPTNTPAAASGPPVPAAYLRRNPALTNSAVSALAQGERAMREPTASTIGTDGRVLFTYGVGLPSVVCAPLRICTIELQPGERLTGQPQIGDSTRWEVEPGNSGSGERATPVLLVKPHEVGLDTNLVVMTDRRTYYMRLVSRESDYIARTAFSYQDDENHRWQAYLADQEKRKISEQAQATIAPVAENTLDKLNYNYKIKGGPPAIRPVMVFDNGNKTYIQMPAAALHRELPTLIVQNSKIKGQKGEEMVNFRVRNNIFIVDRLFDRAALLLGTGKKASKVEIRRADSVEGGT